MYCGMCFVKRYVILPFQWSPQCASWKWHTARWLQGVCLCRADEDAADIARRCADHRGKDAVICALPEHFDLGEVLRHLLTALTVRKPLCAGIFSASAVWPYFKGGGVCILFSMEQTSA